ncbi:Do family serine endopeptidase [Phreatobacter aquaticus]|uniref:Do family serine endopeptidase n=1 Tax=Phreatobacter aquaticus TaxID=2570229 RepID=A0A4D7QNG3_9HYPH|nr:Do family serine endopeptidase [Phreatobacter aquaticus]QCK87149.1 Do family serine endopeptidase [Phreatobacter aquaticus]
MTRFASLIAAASLALASTATLVLAQAPQRQAPSSRAEVQLSFAPVVKRAAPAVVNVYGARVEQVRNAFFDDPIFRRFFGDRGGGQGPQREEVARSLGSGVVADASGLVVTNNHVVENMTEVKISLADRREFEVDIVLRDPRTDLAILKIRNPPSDLAVLPIGDSDALEVGDIVLAIGNPFGVGQTVTQGIVSALARTQVGVADFQSFVQTDAAINPGNSGGALVDMSGNLVGINTAIFSRSGGSHGIGFAIPTAMARLVLDSARAGSPTVRRPWFGATLQTVSPELLESLGLARPTGALVVTIVANSPAAKAGLRVGDLITAVDGREIENPDGFGYRFGIRPIGGLATLAVTRERRNLIIPVALEIAPAGPRDAEKITGISPFQGATVSSVSPALADQLRVSHRLSGVVITEVEPGSPAAQVGLQPGDFVLGVNGSEIKAPRDLQQATAQRARLWRFQIDRQGQVINSMMGG